jgi:predicted TIM-barrel fold metal-dependent hydrolase
MSDQKSTTRAIDGLVNVSLGDQAPPKWMVRVKEDYFKAGDSMFQPVELDALIDEMDANGVERAIVMANFNDDSNDRAFRYVEARPDRLSLALGGHDLLHPMPNLERLTAAVRDLPVAYTVVGPSFWGDGMYPPSDAVYYPLYTKCCELGLPLCLNTGIPGPPLPADAQNPIHLDRVCVRFPELKLCMIHGADPWWDTAIRLMIKYRNLHLMTSAWSPRRLPESLLHYMRTRGPDKVMFASDSPVLPITRCIGEATQLDLPAEVLDKYLYRNADRFFFGNEAS